MLIRKLLLSSLYGKFEISMSQLDDLCRAAFRERASEFFSMGLLWIPGSPSEFHSVEFEQPLDYFLAPDVLGDIARALSEDEERHDDPVQSYSQAVIDESGDLADLARRAWLARNAGYGREP